MIETIAIVSGVTAALGIIATAAMAWRYSSQARDLSNAEVTLSAKDQTIEGLNGQLKERSNALATAESALTVLRAELAAEKRKRVATATDGDLRDDLSGRVPRAPSGDSPSGPAASLAVPATKPA